MSQEPVWFAGTRWKRSPFLVASTVGNPPDSERIGWVGVDFPRWGIHNNMKGFILTHLPSGLSAGQAPSPDVASEVAQRLEVLPFKWDADTADVIGTANSSHLTEDEQVFYLETQALLTQPAPTEEKKPEPRALRTPRTRAAPSP